MLDCRCGPTKSRHFVQRASQLVTRSSFRSVGGPVDKSVPRLVAIVVLIWPVGVVRHQRPPLRRVQENNRHGAIGVAETWRFNGHYICEIRFNVTCRASPGTIVALGNGLGNNLDVEIQR